MKLTELPKIRPSNREPLLPDHFPVRHYSYSSMVRFSSNPMMFKVMDINGDIIDTAHSASSVLGTAFHKAMEVYYGGSDEHIITSEQDAIEFGMKVGMEFLEMYNDGFINYSTTIKNKQALMDRFAYVFGVYVRQKPHSLGGELVSCEEKIEERVSVEWRGHNVDLPVKLKGYLDKLVRVDGKLKIVDYKVVSAFSDPEAIDARKIIQTCMYYFLTYAKYQEEPYSFIYEEVKHSQNKDGSPQVREYEIVFRDNEQFFDFFLRFYDDMTRALLGEMVWVPNVNALYDNEVAIVSYIHKLDVNEERAKAMKQARVENITDLLKKKIVSARSMKQFMKTVEQKFISAKTINYEKMKNEEKIATKLMEHGIMLTFDSKVEGATVDLYRYTPAIGVKMARIASYTADIEQVLGMSGIRILAPIPDSTHVGIEVPRGERVYPHLKDVPADGFNLAIGTDTQGRVHRFDIRTAPHMLVAGSTGSGKSVFLNAMVEQLNALDGVELILCDPKMIELSHHRGKKNVVEYQQYILGINTTLENLVATMNARYKTISETGKADFPYIFAIVDEFGDLIAQQFIDTRFIPTGKVYSRGKNRGEQEVKKVEVNISQEIEKSILLLAQKARAARIHMIIATQRPSVDIIKGSLKANFPTKVAFRTAKATDSVVILDDVGAEKLLGKGDMLFSSDKGIVRLQGFLV